MPYRKFLPFVFSIGHSIRLRNTALVGIIDCMCNIALMPSLTSTVACINANDRYKKGKNAFLLFYSV